MIKPLSQMQAILFAVAGFALWVLTDACIKLGAEAALPPQEVAGILSLVGALTMVLKVTGRGGFRTLLPVSYKKQMVGAVLQLIINLCNVVALKHLPFTLFYIAVFTAPMVIAALGSWILKEHLTAGKIAAIVAGFLGVVIAVDPLHHVAYGGQYGDWIGYTAALCAVLCFSLNMLWTRRITRSETPDSMAFFQAAFQTVGCGVLLIFSNAPLALTIVLILCAAGILNVLGTLCNLIATKNTTAATVAQFHYTQLISGAIIGYLVWHEVPTLHLLAGSAVIVASGVYIANHMRKEALAADIRPL